VKKRPIALLLAMILLSLVGLSGFFGAISDIAWYRGDATEEARIPAGTSEEDAAHISALAARRREIRDAGRGRLLPLAVANLLLSALLFVAANRALVGRPGARSLAVQAMAANALLAIATHALTVDVRGQLIDAMVANLPKSALKLSDAPLEPAVLWLMYRVQLVLGLGMYAACFAAISTRSAREYLAPVIAGREDE
jgi:hypothetical protein